MPHKGSNPAYHKPPHRMPRARASPPQTLRASRNSRHNSAKPGSDTQKLTRLVDLFRANCPKSRQPNPPTRMYYNCLKRLLEAPPGVPPNQKTISAHVSDFKNQLFPMKSRKKVSRTAGRRTPGCAGKVSLRIGVSALCARSESRTGEVTMWCSSPSRNPITINWGACPPRLPLQGLCGYHHPGPSGRLPIVSQTIMFACPGCLSSFLCLVLLAPVCT